jgi:hypothetical protein
MSFPAADYYGHPRSTQKHTNHFFEDMHSFIAAMAKRFPIHLAITVGHPAMIGTASPEHFRDRQLPHARLSAGALLQHDIENTAPFDSI